MGESLVCSFSSLSVTSGTPLWMSASTGTKEKSQAPTSGETCILSTLTLSSFPPMREALGSTR